MTNLTEEELRRLVADAASRAAEEAVKRTLLAFGIDPHNPTEVQRDFGFLRSWRLLTEAGKRQGVIAAVGLIVSGIGAAIWMFFRPQ